MGEADFASEVDLVSEAAVIYDILYSGYGQIVLLSYVCFRNETLFVGIYLYEVSVASIQPSSFITGMWEWYYAGMYFLSCRLDFAMYVRLRTSASGIRVYCPRMYNFPF